MKATKLVLLTLVLCGLTGFVTAYGDIVYTLKTDDSQDAFVNRDAILSNDLVNQGQATVASMNSTPMCGINGGAYDSTAIVDGGMSGAYQNDDGLLWGGTYLEVYLNLNAATGGSANGYDINQVRVFSGWNDNRKDHWYAIELLKVGEADWYRIKEVDLKSSGLPQGIESIVASDVSGESIGTNIQALRIIMLPVVNEDWTAWIGSVYQEMDVIGTASVPEPATMSLLVMGGLGVLLRRKK